MNVSIKTIKLSLAILVASSGFSQAFATNTKFQITIHRNTWDYGNVKVNVSDTEFDWKKGETSAWISNGSPSTNSSATLKKPTRIWLTNPEPKFNTDKVNYLCSFDLSAETYSQHSQISIDFYVDTSINGNTTTFTPTCKLYGFKGTSWETAAVYTFDHRSHTSGSHGCGGMGGFC